MLVIYVNIGLNIYLYSDLLWESSKTTCFPTTDQTLQEYVNIPQITDLAFNGH